MKRLSRLAIVLLIPLFWLGCTTTNAMGQQEISWVPTLVMWILLSVAVVVGAISIGNAIKG